MRVNLIVTTLDKKKIFTQTLKNKKNAKKKSEERKLKFYLQEHANTV